MLHVTKIIYQKFHYFEIVIAYLAATIQYLTVFFFTRKLNTDYLLSRSRDTRRVAAVEFQILRSNIDSAENAFDKKNVTDVLCIMDRMMSLNTPRSVYPIQIGR